MQTQLRSASLICAISFISFISSAGIIRVPEDQPGIQAGIDAAGSSDTVLVAPGEYFENIHFNKNIILGSMFITTGDSAYISQTIINADSNGTAVDVAFVTFPSRITGFTITNGNAEEGAGIRIDGSQITVEHVRLINNYSECENASSGAAVFAKNSVLRLKNFVLDSNLALCESPAINSQGGAIYARNTELYLTNGLVSNNTSDVGGGICLVQGKAVIKEVDFINNVANWPGGAIASFASKIVADNLIFRANEGAGAALYAVGPQSVTFRNCLFTEHPRTVFTVNTILLRLINCTLTENYGTHSIIFLSRVNFHALNTFFWNGFEHELNFMGSNNLSYIGNTCITGGKAGITGQAQLNYFGPVYNTDPLFSAEYPYHLSDYSSYIGVGLDTLDTYPYIKAPVFDLAGNPRPLPEGSMPDLGVYENELGDPLVGIPEKHSANISIYPNPSSGKFYVRNMSGEEISLIRVRKMNGAVVKEIHFDKAGSSFSETMLSLRGHCGVYFLELLSGQTIHRKKLLIVP